MNPATTRLAGEAVKQFLPQIAARMGLGIGLPAVMANIHGRGAGYNDPAASGMGGGLGYGVLGTVAGGLPSGALASIAYGKGREKGRDKRINELLFGDAVTDSGGIVNPNMGIPYNPLLMR